MTAKHDVKAIAAAIYAFRSDVKEWPIWKDGMVCTPAGGGDSSARAYAVLKSADGTHPAHDEVHALSTEWAQANFDTLENQLVLGAPGGDVAKRYPDRAGNTSSPFRGPYLSDGLIAGATLTTGTYLPKDPWGNKYLVNIRYLWPEELNHGTPNREVVFVISAGPNETLETDFSQDLLQGGPGGGKFTIRGDDIVCIIGAN
ncbi:MAG: hypothetical protein NTV77_01365 [Candidatus Azambacteria bacterium]|nr:hypothetical protein [Candidatus Azambacteria bacterium]